MTCPNKPNKREVLQNPLYTQNNNKRIYPAVGKFIHLATIPHTISGAVTRIWTPNVKKSQLRSDQGIKVSVPL